MAVLKLASIISIAIAIALLALAADAKVGIPGDRTPIKDVKHNKDVQDLGFFCVDEANKHGVGDGAMVFEEVVEAEKQVVAGVLYYLKISVQEGHIQHILYDAVVLVQGWKDTQTRKLLSFKRAHN